MTEADRDTWITVIPYGFECQGPLHPMLRPDPKQVERRRKAVVKLFRAAF